MKKEHLKYGMFTEGEFAFLLDKVKRGVLVTEKERIEIEGMDIKFNQMYINNIHYVYKNIEADKNAEQKLKITKAIKEADDFTFECYGGDYDDCSNYSCTLITYKLTREPYKTYIERIKIVGRSLLALEKTRLKRVAKLEVRKVLTEKNKKRKVGRPKKEIVENVNDIVAEELRRFRVPYNRFRMV